MMRVVDLFAGCGGMSLGFQKAGLNVVAAFDHWSPAANVYQRNFSHPIFLSDLNEKETVIPKIRQFQPDIIIGGPPCQDFSSAGKRDESLGRADLTVIFAEIITTIQSEWFVMENVDRAVKANAYHKAKQLFKCADYGLTELILDASFFGVPQKRKRLFLIGQKDGSDNGVKNAILGQQSAKRMKLRDYFGDSLGIEHYYRHPWSYARRGVFSIDEPSPTVRGVNRPIPPNYPGHKGDTAPVNDELRPLTTKERSMIQTFPADFVFEGNKSDMEQMIGNAVPVNLATAIANAILTVSQNPSSCQRQSLEYDQLSLL